MKLPEQLKQLINTEKYELDTTGMSGASIMIFKDKVLKISKESHDFEYEINIMQWLNGKLPVPEIIYYEKHDGMNYLLMSKLQGVMACDNQCMKNPEKLAEILASGIKMLWNTDISECNYKNNLDKKLQIARYNVENDLVDIKMCEADTFGENGFDSPNHLLKWLTENKPQEDYVLSHGDFCLPNIFIKDDKISGFLDLGRMGIADKYQDIALCYRSLRDNYNGRYGTKKYEKFNPDILFEKLKIEPDWDKIKYYMLLDELF